MRSWRSWGGIATPEQAAEEASRIKQELTNIAQSANFPVEFGAVASVKDVREMANTAEVKAADVVIVKLSSLPRAVVEFAEENTLLGFHTISTSLC